MSLSLPVPRKSAIFGQWGGSAGFLPAGGAVYYVERGVFCEVDHFGFAVVIDVRGGGSGAVVAGQALAFALPSYGDVCFL